MKKTKKILGAVIIAALLISGIGVQFAAQSAIASEQEILNQEQGSAIERLTLDKLTASADSILLGQVADMACYDEDSLYSLITFQVEQAIKGEIEGWVVIRVSAEEVDAADFHLGERVIVFLKKGEDFFTVTGGLQGKYTIQDDRVLRTGQALAGFVAEISELLEAQSDRPEMSVKQASLVLDTPVQSIPVEPEETPLAGAWQNIMTEDFEGVFPGTGWNVFDNGGLTDAYWGKDGYRSHSGLFSAFCAGDGTAAVTPPANYPNYMDAWMVYGHFSLADATDAKLDFYLWLDSEYNYDFIYWMASINGINFYGGGGMGYSDGWVDVSFDLTNVYILGDLCGESQVWIVFIFTSDFCNIGDYQGAFIDDVELRKFVGVKEPDISLDKDHLDFELSMGASSAEHSGSASESSSLNDSCSRCNSRSPASTDDQHRNPEAGLGAQWQSAASEQAQLEAIRKAIEEKGAQWEAGITSVSGLSLEAKKRLCGAKFGPMPEDVETVTPALDLAVLPSAFDWRDEDGIDWMTSVKDQNPCGTCWVFGTLGSLEAAINIYRDDPDIDMDLSEQMILSCAPGITPTCCGGDPQDTYDYLAMLDGGTPNEACFTYQCPAYNPSPDPEDGCTNPVPCDCCLDWAQKAWEVSYIQVSPDTTEAYKAALLEYGPLGVPMRADDDWFFYAGGIYEPVLESEEWRAAFPYGQANHWVTLVGYVDGGLYGDIGVDGGGYWIVKNSWSRDWGEEGYGKILYGDIEKHGYTFAITSVEGPDNCKSVTVYNDGDGNLEVSDVSISYGMGEPTGWLDAERKSFTLTPPERAPGQLHVRDSEGITVWVDTTGLNAGEYHGTLNIISNDPDENPTIVPVTLHVSTGEELESLDYFNTIEGHGIKYQVTDDYGSLDCDVWAVSQCPESNKPHEIDFVFTLVKEGEEGDYFYACSLGGEDSCPYGSNNLTYFRYGYPVGYQGWFYRNFSLPRYFNSGDEWTMGDREYTVEDIGTQIINGTLFDDCIRITIDDSLNDWDYFRGNGYFILARDIGIVELSFDRTIGGSVLYEYLDDEQLTRHAISGNIYYSFSGLPVEGIIVQLSNANWGTRSVTDASGAFSIQAYGPDVVLRIGYDEDSDDVFEFDDPTYPIKYWVNNITSDVTGLCIYIPAPDITVTPTSFEKTLAPDTSQNYTLTIGNEGDAELIYSIADEDTTMAATPGERHETVLRTTGEAAESSSQNYYLDYEDSYEKEATAKDVFEGEQSGVISGPASVVLDIPLGKGSVLEPEGTFTAGGWQNIMTEDFEGDFPGTKWVEFGRGFVTCITQWVKDDHNCHGGSYSAWYERCTTPGNAGIAYGPFDLSDASDAELNFYYFYDLQECSDPGAIGDSLCFGWGASVGASIYTAPYYFGEEHCSPSDSGGWQYESFDLTNVPGLGDLCGQSQVWIWFWAGNGCCYADTGQGAFIDDVVLRKYTEGVPEDCPWLDEDPKSGTVPAGCPADAITVTIDTSGLSEGDYSANIVIANNDPDENPKIVPVTLHVSSANNLPNTPSNPSPADDATGVSINADLSWTGGDPDIGDTVTYDVYFGTSVSPPLVSNDQSATTYDPGTLNNNTKYYWKIVATDNHAASTTGPVWDFTTEVSAPEVQVSIDVPDEVAADGEFVARVNISSVEDFNSCNYDLSYDPSVIGVIGAEHGPDGVTNGLIDGTEIPVVWGFIPPGVQGTVRVIQYLPIFDSVTGEGYLAEIHFHVLGEACDSSELDLHDGKLTDNTAGDIPAEWIDGSVHVSECPLRGDVNMDGRVNSADITKLERIMLQLDPPTPCVDVNGDGRINSADITKIQRIMLQIDC